MIRPIVVAVIVMLADLGWVAPADAHQTDTLTYLFDFGLAPTA